jgi:hypothetical protein
LEAGDQPLIVNLLDEAAKVFGDVAEAFEVHQKRTLGTLMGTPENHHSKNDARSTA